MKPQPHTATTINSSEDLLKLVNRGDVQGLRDYLDTSLGGDVIVRPQWTHLRAALANNNTAMMKLLVTWGATPTQEDIAQHLENHRNTAGHDIQRLRLAGLNISALPHAVPAHSAAIAREDRIPSDWKKLLHALHQNGSPEAVIAGGALRDLFNGRTIKDVDIFLAAPSFKKQETLLRRAFETAGLTLKNRVTVHKDSYGRSTGFSTKSALERTSAKNTENVFGVTTAWTAQSASETGQTEFNIVFMKGLLANHMREAARMGGVNNLPPVWALIDRFDVGLCQIAFNGYQIIESEKYVNDVKNKTLSLTVRPANTTADHLGRLVKKYPDFKADARIRDILEKEKTARRATSIYGVSRSMYTTARRVVS